MSELVVVGLHRVPGRPGHGGYDVALLSEESVGDGRLAGVGPAYYGDTGYSGVLILLLFGVGQHGYEPVQHVAGAAAVGRGDVPRVAQTKRVELV